MMIHEINGVKLMRWHRLKGGAFIFAKASNVFGYLKLRLRGYKPTETMFGELMKKEFDVDFTNRSK